MHNYYYHYYYYIKKVTVTITVITQINIKHRLTSIQMEQ